MRAPRTRGYRELLGLFGLLAFASSFTGSFWVVFLTSAHGLHPAAIAALIGVATLVAALGSFATTRARTLPATRTMIAGLACLAAMQLALAIINGPPLYLLFAVLYGAYIPLFFLPWNVLVTEETKARDRGVKLAGIQLAFALATAPAPFLGGIVANVLGWPALFAIGAGILFVAAGLAAVRGDARERVALEWDPRALGRGAKAAYLAQGGTEGVLWTAIPLVTYSFVQREVELGALFSLFALTGGLLAVVLGRRSDRTRRRRRFIALGVSLSIPLAVSVAVAPNLLAFSVATGALSAVLAIAPTFANAAVVDRLEGRVGLVMGTREVLLNLARGTTSIAILLLFLAGLPVQLAILLVPVLLPLEALAR